MGKLVALIDILSHTHTLTHAPHTCAAQQSITFFLSSYQFPNLKWAGPGPLR